MQQPCSFMRISPRSGESVSLPDMYARAVKAGMETMQRTAMVAGSR